MKQVLFYSALLALLCVAGSKTELLSQTCTNPPQVNFNQLGLNIFPPQKELHILGTNSTCDPSIRLQWNEIGNIGHLALTRNDSYSQYTNLYRPISSSTFCNVPYNDAIDMILSASTNVRDLILSTRSQCGMLRFATGTPVLNGGWWTATPNIDRECMRITPMGYVGIGFNSLETDYNNPLSNFDVQLNPWYNSTRIAFARTGQKLGIAGSSHSTIRIYQTVTDATCSALNSNNFCAVPFWIEAKRSIEDVSLQIKSSTSTYAPGYEDDNSNETIMKPIITFLRNGNVGIGDANPNHKLVIDGKVRIGSANVANTSAYFNSYKLSVDGTILAKEIVVSTSADNWADFVFDANYSLMPITELAKKIKIEKKLPDMPSAQQVQKNGIPLGEIQAKLLQKNQELTLYLIDLKSENDALKKRIDNLEQK
ncbi:MAG: hypothetical protein NT007_16000 [Candidatus Kapabacteria bacterium]|nr:hypothetical protein [Candidatus Kapabacteria bacterium]